jgi:GNAT superfamily N-acetyltransferase
LRTIEYQVTHLVLDAPQPLPVSTPAPLGLSLRREADDEKAAVAALCYGAVGKQWSWIDRREWTSAAWHSAVANPSVEVWTIRQSEGLAGYFQLEQAGPDVTIQYFGLLPAWVGKGLGRWLLNAAIQRSVELEARQIRLETCSLDSPAALPNYLARGFRIERHETRRRSVP